MSCFLPKQWLMRAVKTVNCARLLRTRVLSVSRRSVRRCGGVAAVWYVRFVRCVMEWVRTFERVDDRGSSGKGNHKYKGGGLGVQKATRKHRVGKRDARCRLRRPCRTCACLSYLSGDVILGALPARAFRSIAVLTCIVLVVVDNDRERGGGKI